MRPTVLIVDDGSDIILEVKELMVSLKKDWHYFMARKIADAEKFLELSDINVVICDSRHKAQNGKPFQIFVKENYTEAVRILVASEREKDIPLQMSKAAHQLIARPFNINALISRLEKTFFLRERLKSDRLIRLISGLENLPSSPKIYMELELALRDEDVSIRLLEEIVSRDVTMTAKIMQLVNSPFFGLANRVRNLMEAINLLGINTIKTLTLYTEIFSSFKATGDLPFSIDELWIHSIRTAKNAKIIMKTKVNDRAKHDDAYIAGILHDIGKLILCESPGYYKSLRNLLITKDISYVDAEIELIGATHAEVGAYLLSLWGLSEDIVEAVAFHHYPSITNDMEFSALSAVHIANATEYLIPHIDTKHLKYLGISSDFVEIVEKVR